jgi:hypothetical protein
MNIYNIKAPDVWFEDIVDMELGGPYWYEDVEAFVLAETPGQARVFLMKDLGIREFTFKASIKLYARNVNWTNGPEYISDEFVSAHPGLFPEWDNYLAENVEAVSAA